ncbi:Mu-like protein prophage tail sheath protein gpL-like protein [Acetobacter orientalis]|uniref:Mu-like protein prophage tail sheath protein gpL-like protein n=1 Tax=Acetobacter orientalis TaxID=146474 RepID=A0A2Z5ZI45_9PROT|nr:Mu-like protein prophage tail sheath protein gpL-like protein [Acetobacter orientalis]
MATITTGVPSSDNIPGTKLNIYSAGNSDVTVNQVILLLGTLSKATDPAPTGVVNKLTLVTGSDQLATLVGSDSDIYEMYQGVENNGITAYFVAAASNSAADIATALEAVGDLSYWLVHPYASVSGVVNVIDSALSPSWSYLNADYCYAISAIEDSVTNLVTTGKTMNSAYNVVFALPTYLGSEPLTASLATRVGKLANEVIVTSASDPTAGIQALSVSLSPVDNSQAFSRTNRNTLFNSGFAIVRQDLGGESTIERGRTTYQTNAVGTADTSYRDIETLNKLAYAATSFTQILNNKFFAVSKKLITDDSTPIPAGSTAVTLSTISSACIEIYNTLQTELVVQKLKAFSSNQSVVYAGDGKVDVYLPLYLTNTLRAINIGATFTVS